ncbi:uL11 family ribosomal protein [Stackebrandtia nassauensis]|uniref:Large ribosomal subunit protein uL11 n=1 Tax=Stackebrandtia nassauensis (strain DSM 44728 / CIP 108903 / NRRL B-16338 / NBRC 102104 / LLR-40K-21) TaxID=446470 RepID=D3PU96_STANL|nr:50S ribosomal protein L11 [Stackebrandtia nassauensis]ADD41042.1 ribosomal protein L11 [Stackebrandtia nassauensis DSM 44728]
MSGKDTVRMTLELEAGNASVAELGKMLGQVGLNIREVKRAYDEATASQRGDIVPVVVTVEPDRSYRLRYKTPPTAFLIRKALGRKGSDRPGHEAAGELDQRRLREIAQRKLPDLNTSDVEAAMRMIAGTARSMGVTIAPT